MLLSYSDTMADGSEFIMKYTNSFSLLLWVLQNIFYFYVYAYIK